MRSEISWNCESVESRRAGQQLVAWFLQYTYRDLFGYYPRDMVSYSTSALLRASLGDKTSNKKQ
jgi:hypothetical protein